LYNNRMAPTVVAVCRSPTYSFHKYPEASIRLVAGHGVEGDVHAGPTVKHRSRVARDPTVPNLRQVHLLHEELLIELRAAGFPVDPGTVGENVTTRGLDLLGLPTGTKLQLGDTAVVEVTGLRNPCYQLDGVKDGLKNACLDRDDDGNLIRKAGVMAVVLAGGEVKPWDTIRVEMPTGDQRPLHPV
jgi:MOSC domain-containing protein YiiM